MPLLLKHRPLQQRNALKEKYDATLPTAIRPKRQSPFSASREHHTRLGFHITAWYPVPPFPTDDSQLRREERESTTTGTHSTPFTGDK